MLSARALAPCMAFALTGCASTYEAQYFGASGLYGSGSIQISGTFTDGRFEITDGTDTCRGEFAKWMPLTVVFPVTCTSGKSGSASLTRPFEGLMSGRGTLHLSNGERRDIAWTHTDLK